jgi:hypothetical protein
VVEAEFTVVALNDDLLRIVRSQFLHIALNHIQVVQQRVERRAKVEAASTPITNVEDAERLLLDDGPVQPLVCQFEALHRVSSP